VATVTYTFHAPPPGEYNFQCDVHPGQMKGKVKVA
jgi:plastocyanin